MMLLGRLPSKKKKEFAGTESLRAVECENVVRLGGKNVAEQVYSASCYADELAGAGTWNCLMTLLADTVRISPYVN